MKKTILLLGILAFLLLFAGCINLSGGTPEKGKTTAGQTGGQAQAGSEQAAGGVAGAAEEAIGNLEQALAQNVPLECTAVVTSEGETVTAHYWTKDGNVRTETQSGGQKMVSILKNNKIYVSMAAAPESGIKCDWLVFEQGESKPETEAYSASTKNYENMGEVKVDCKPAVFGNEKFETPGKVCTMQDLIPPMENLPPGYEKCQGLSGQALMDCLSQEN